MAGTLSKEQKLIQGSSRRIHLEGKSSDRSRAAHGIPCGSGKVFYGFGGACATIKSARGVLIPMWTFTSEVSGRRWAAAAAIALVAFAALAAVSLAGGAEALSNGDEFTEDNIKYGVVSVYENYVEITGHEGEPVRVEGTVSYEGSDWTVVSGGKRLLGLRLTGDR